MKYSKDYKTVNVLAAVAYSLIYVGDAIVSAAQLLREPVGDTPQACSDYMHDFNKKYNGYIECPYCHKRLVP